MQCPCPVPTIAEMQSVAFLVAFIFVGVVFAEYWFNVRSRGGRS